MKVLFFSSLLAGILFVCQVEAMQAPTSSTIRVPDYIRMMEIEVQTQVDSNTRIETEVVEKIRVAIEYYLMDTRFKTPCVGSHNRNPWDILVPPAGVDQESADCGCP